jgi:hypothetical protein
MSTPDRDTGLGRITTRTLLDEVTELREDIQAQSVILAEMDRSLRNLFTEMRRANIGRYKPAAED